TTWRNFKSKYGVVKGHEAVIRRKDEGERGVTYTVQVGPFESRDDADQLCKQLKTAGGICFLVRDLDGIKKTQHLQYSREASPPVRGDPDRPPPRPPPHLLHYTPPTSP